MFMTRKAMMAVLGVGLIVSVAAACATTSAVPAGSVSGHEALPTGTWELSDIQGRSLVPKTTIKLRISGAALDAFPGCNELTGTLETTQTTIHLTDWRITEKGCFPNPNDFMAQESWFVKWLEDGVDWTATDDQLVLRGASVNATFVRHATL